MVNRTYKILYIFVENRLEGNAQDVNTWMIES